MPRAAQNEYAVQGMIRRTKTYDVDDALVANELYQDNGWTDGLPIIPPTEKLVRAFLDSAQLGPRTSAASSPCDVVAVLEDLSTGEPERLEGVDSVVAAAGGVAEGSVVP